MKVSLSWLKEYVAIQTAEKKLADALTMVGLEIEAMTDRFSPLNAVRVGRIKTVSAHPDADRLTVCEVDVGNAVLNIVCGAPNAAPNCLVPVAMPGAVLPGGLEIKKSVIRGQHSDGMLCGESELGLGIDTGGLMILDGDVSLGDPLPKALGLSDTVLEIGLTPNRPDCLSVIGVAREAAAIQNLTVQYPALSPALTGNAITQKTSVTISSPDHCPRYAACLIEDITVAPSPFWLQDRLLSIGLRPINNIVDITNFVMMEMGQPLHAFDFDQLAENRIVVRTAQEGEIFTTLDKKERRLSSDTLMICDGEKPVAVAGVMGGLNSEIETKTTRVLLESACFDAISIRKTAKRLGLATDASHRFERGVDPHITLRAMNRAAQLMAEIAGGTRIEGWIDEHPGPAPARTIDLSVSGTNRLLGTNLEKKEMEKFLSAVEIELAPPEDAAPDLIRATPPSYRVDITRPEDLMEEVARLSGYNNIPTTFPVMSGGTVQLTGRVGLRKTLRQVMVGLGFFEAINYSFIHRNACDQMRITPDDPKRRTVTILNPLSEDQTVMRSSLLPGLLKTMHHNNSKQLKDLKLFEVGKIFTTKDKDTLPEENEMLAALWTGSRTRSSWHHPPVNCDFYDIKGALEGLFAGLDIQNIVFSQQPDDCCRYTRPGHTAQILFGNELIGLVGEVHPETLGMFDIKQSAFIFELDLEKLEQLVPDQKTFIPLSKFPATSRDVTLIIDQAIESFRVLEMVNTGDEPLVERTHLFDIFEGKPIPAGKKSISFRITYRSTNETLEDELINDIHHNISQRLIQAFKADLPA